MVFMFAYRSLSADDPKILEHLLALTPADRRCRFHGLTSDERIRHYCDEMTRREAHLIGCLEGERLVGLIEIVPCGEGAERRGEVGMSVAPDRRDHGIGHALVQHALDFAANHGVALVFGYLPDNVRIPRIVHDLGGRVNRLAAEAQLPAPAPTAFSLYLEAIDDLGLFAADMLDFWHRALLAPLAKPAQAKRSPGEAA
jgi:GNAT superfamily N-acetyltransferase